MDEKRIGSGSSGSGHEIGTNGTRTSIVLDKELEAGVVVEVEGRRWQK